MKDKTQAVMCGYAMLNTGPAHLCVRWGKEAEQREKRREGNVG
jgi:hypothetical protein